MRQVEYPLPYGCKIHLESEDVAVPHGGWDGRLHTPDDPGGRIVRVGNNDFGEALAFFLDHYWRWASRTPSERWSKVFNGNR